MAVTFLVVSRRESEQVSTLSQQNNAKFAASIAADAAQTQVIAQMLATSNAYNFGLLVSTNFISPYFDNTGAPTAPFYTNIANVAYNYANGSTNFSANDLGQMLNNLLILPRVPVFTSNRYQTSTDFRFYLDLNRNTNYDPNNTVMILTNDSGESGNQCLRRRPGMGGHPGSSGYEAFEQQLLHRALCLHRAAHWKFARF